MEKEVTESMEKEGIKCSLVSGDLRKLPYEDESFDCIVTISTLEHIKDLDEAMDSFKRVIKPNGKLYLGVPVRNDITRAFFEKICGIDCTDDMHVSSQKDIYDAVKAKFKVNAVTTFPKFLPMDYSFYVMIEAERV